VLNGETELVVALVLGLVEPSRVHVTFVVFAAVSKTIPIPSPSSSRVNSNFWVSPGNIPLNSLGNNGIQ